MSASGVPVIVSKPLPEIKCWGILFALQLLLQMLPLEHHICPNNSIFCIQEKLTSINHFLR